MTMMTATNHLKMAIWKELSPARITTGWGQLGVSLDMRLKVAICRLWEPLVLANVHVKLTCLNITLLCPQ